MFSCLPKKECNISSLEAKGQLISKAIYGLLTSPKKRTDEFVLFAFLLFPANNANMSVHFLGESTNLLFDFSAEEKKDFVLFSEEMITRVFAFEIF